MERLWTTNEFRCVDAPARKAWLALARPEVRVSNAGELVWEQDSSPEELVVLLSGTVQLEERRDRAIVIVRELSAPSVVGWSVVSGSKHSASGRACSRVEWVGISRADFLALIRLCPEVALAGFRTLGAWLASASAKNKGVSPTRGAVVQFLSEAFSASDSEPVLVSLSELARRHGVSASRISVILRQLEEKGAIARRGQAGAKRRVRVALLDRTRLT